jgi:hypothetical protein
LIAITFVIVFTMVRASILMPKAVEIVEDHIKGLLEETVGLVINSRTWTTTSTTTTTNAGRVHVSSVCQFSISFISYCVFMWFIYYVFQMNQRLEYIISSFPQFSFSFIRHCFFVLFIHCDFQMGQRVRTRQHNTTTS